MTDATTVWVDTHGPDDGARVAVHHLGGVTGATPLLVSHATGFHARAYRAVAAALGERYDVWGLDHRGHGATPAPPGWRVDWRGYGHDARVVAAWLTERTGRAVTGFGHSMGGATLVMASADAPDLFDALVLYEPIVFPPDPDRSDPETIPLVVGARRRRARFDSFAAAYANYAAKPPLAWFRPDVLHDYVEYGLRADPTPDQPEGVVLCCAPDHEGDTFANSTGNGSWEAALDVKVPTTVVGSGDGDGPALIAPAVAERIPAARFVALPERTHFGPFTHPDETAALLP